MSAPDQPRPNREALCSVISALIESAEIEYTAKYRKADCHRASIRVDVSIHTLRSALNELKNKSQSEQS